MSNETIPQNPNPRKVPADVLDQVRKRIESACSGVMVADDDITLGHPGAARERLRDAKVDLHDALVWLSYAGLEVTP